MNKQENQEIKNAISACLVGVPCRWDSKHKTDKDALEIYLRGQTLTICPEIIGGMTTPRPACEIVGGDGADVLAGRAKVVDKDGNDYTLDFITGAKKTLKIILNNNISKVILKSGSPSCGVNAIYDGSFSGTTKVGQGVFTALLKNNNIEVVELGK